MPRPDGSILNRSTLQLLVLLMALEQSRGPLERGIGGLVNRAAPMVLDNIDLDDLIARLDVDEIAQRMDLDALVGRMDLDALIGQLDMDAIAQRLDLDALVGRMDINAIAERLDLDELMKSIEITSLVSRGSQEVAESGIDLLRRQVIRIDLVINATVRAVLRRDKEELPIGPGLMQEQAE
jgi:hypothetical protein